MANEISYILKLKDEASSTLSKFSSQVSSGADGMTAFGKKATLAGVAISAATVPLAMYGKSAFELASQTESAWVGVRKVYDGTAESVDNELIPATERMAIAFGKNKLEIIDVVQALASMGETGPGLIDKTTQALQFAVLGNMDLDLAMKTVIATSAIFGVEGEALTKMLASMNTAENAGVATMQDLGIAISTVGNVSKVSGVSVNELNSMMSVLRQRGIDAGEGANALKTIFTRLRRPSDDAVDIMKKYGITIEETTAKTGTFTRTVGGNADELKKLQKILEGKVASLAKYEQGISGANLSDASRAKTLDKLRKEIENTNIAIKNASGATETYTGTQQVATGKLKDADQILISIAQSWKKMTDAEREELSFQLGTMYQKDKFLALMDDLNDSSSEYSRVLKAQGDDAVNTAGYFKELGIAQDSNSFKVAQANARWEQMKETVGFVLLEALTPIITAVSELATRFGQLDPWIQQSIVAVGLFVVVLGPLLIAVGTLAMAIGAIGIPAAIIIAVISALIALFVVFRETIMSFLTDVWNKAYETFTWLGTFIATELINWYNSHKQFVDLVIQLFITWFEAIKNNFQNTFEIVKFIFLAIKSVVEITMQVIKVVIDSAFKAIEAIVSVVMEGLRMIFGDKLDVMLEKAKFFKDVLVLTFKIMASQITEALKSIKFPHLKVGEGMVNIAGKDISYPKLDVDWYEKGGWVKRTGLAMVHDGEFVMSKDMLNGSKEIPSNVSTTTNNSPINVNAVINSKMDAITLGNILGEQLAFARA